MILIFIGVEMSSEANIIISYGYYPNLSLLVLQDSETVTGQTVASEFPKLPYGCSHISTPLGCVYQNIWEVEMLV